jgi:hypothetical protein
METLNEVQGPFDVNHQGQTVTCGSDSFANNDVATKLKTGEFMCDSKFVRKDDNMCNIFSTSDKCETLKDDGYKEFQNHQLPLISGRKVEELSDKVLNDIINFKLIKTRVGAEKILELLYWSYKEAAFRYRHRRDCVCVGDKSHLDRIDLVKKLVKSCAQKLLMIYPQSIKNQWHSEIQIAWDIPIVRFSLAEIGAIYKSSVGAVFAIKESVYKSVQSLSFQIWLDVHDKNRKIDDRGMISFDDSQDFGWLANLWKQGKAIESIHSHINAIITEAIFQEATYRDGTGCIVWNNNKPVDIAINGSALARHISQIANVDINERYVEKEASKLSMGLYRTCINSLAQNQKALLRELCKMRNKFKQGVKVFLDQVCEGGENGGGGDGLDSEFEKIKPWSKPSTTRFIFESAGVKPDGDLTKKFQSLSMKMKKKILRMLEEEIQKQTDLHQWAMSKSIQI